MKERIAFDKQSQRTFDKNGFLHVALSPISKETVNEYYGSEIPGWQELGLDPNRVYNGYRPGEELRKAAETFNGLNILSEHIKDGADNPPREYIIGSMGTDAKYAAPYLMNSLIIKDAKAIELLNPSDPGEAPRREISASYRYRPVFEAGTFQGQPYDFIMMDIFGNHIALVEEGRAGSDVVVSDEKTIGRKSMNPLKIIEDLIASLKAEGIAPHEGGEEEAKKFMGTDQDPAAPPAETPTPAATDADPAAAEPTAGAAPVVAKDDALDNALTELFALADAVSDEELAAKIKGIGEAIRASQGTAPAAEDEDPKPTEEKKEEKPAMDKKTKAASAPAVAMDEAAIAKKVEAAINSKIQAAKACRPILGEVDPMAFDSAAGIYAKALEVSGHPTKVNDPAALREMVALASANRPNEYMYPAVAAALANDAAAKDDPNFAGLANIRRAH